MPKLLPGFMLASASDASAGSALYAGLALLGSQGLSWFLYRETSPAIISAGVTLVLAQAAAGFDERRRSRNGNGEE